jgi:hypothetical protein
MSKENTIINKIKNQVDNINYQQINNSTNLNNLNNSIKSTNNMTNINNNSIKNIRVNKINNTNLNNISQKKSLAYKKPLSHSNSTKEIYSNNNIERYLKLKQSQLASQKKINKNQNIYRQKKNNNNNNNKFNRKNGTNININNYYTNNIFSAIYNNFIPHQNFEKKNEDNKYKKLGQRAMSVFYQKRPISKSNMEKNKNKIDNHENNLSNKLGGYKNNK